MNESIFGIVWWKFFVLWAASKFFFGIPLRAYAEYKIPLIRHGSWSEYYWDKLKLIKQKDFMLYFLFRVQSFVSFTFVILGILSIII